MQYGLLLTAIGTIAFCINGALLSELPTARTPGYLDFDNLPETNFTCEGKVIGGYYADIETGCQMFHVCTIGQRGDMTDIKFLCLNGTVFEQETRVCERVDEVDCARSEDFYDLNLELYHSAGIQPEDDNECEDSKKENESQSGESEEAMYDESYELDTEEPPQTTIRTTTTTLATTTTTPRPTTTTTPKPIPVYTSAKPPFNIVLPNLNNKNTGTHLTGLIPTYTQKTVVPTKMTPVSSPPNYNENRNVGTHLTGFVPGTSQSPRPFGLPPPSQQQPPQQQYSYEPPTAYGGKVPATLDTGLKPPPTNFHLYPGQHSTSLKPPGYENYNKNNYYPSSSPSPPMLVHDYGHNSQQQHHQHLLQEQQKRPLAIQGHHFPALPTKSSYEDYSVFTSPGATFIRYNKAPRPTHKANPTILALQSQQKKVHKLHQEGLEHAEHQIAQVASRNAEISNLQSQQQQQQQQDDTARSYDTDHSGSRETKEIHASNSPAIAIITSTSSTSSARVQKQPITSYVKTVTDEKGVPVSQQVYSATPGLQSELEKLFKNEPKKEEDGDMDLEQLLLAWKLKTNQEVTKSDIEKVFLSLDLSKFKNGETISLSEIFKLMNATDTDNHTTRVPPTTYDEYTEEDVPFDPFFKDVPKVGPRAKRHSNVQVVPVVENGQFRSSEVRRRGRTRVGALPVRVAEIEELTGSVRGRARTHKTIAVEGRTDDSELDQDRRKAVPVLMPMADVVSEGFDGSARRLAEMRDSSEDVRRGMRDIVRVRKVSRRKEIPPVVEEEVSTTTTTTSTTPRPYPKTSFSCRGKIAGGFYADTEADCQFFHICSDLGYGNLQDNKFFCGPGTRFNQRSRTCQANDLVDCSLSLRYYSLNENFRIPVEEPAPMVPHFESTKLDRRKG